MQLRAICGVYFLSCIGHLRLLTYRVLTPVTVPQISRNNALLIVRWTVP